MKRLLKQVLGYFMRGLAFPFYLHFKLEALLVGDRKAIAMTSQAVSLFPGLTGEYLRRGFLQWVSGLELTDCCISFGTTFSDARITLGNGVYIGRGCDIGYAAIGDHCVLGSNVHILSGLKQHDFSHLEIPIREQPQEFSQIRIGEDTWIGNGTIVAAPVGRKCVIGAGSVVVKPIPDFAIAVGNPAKVVRLRQQPSVDGSLGISS
jgi:virginiamycin A acetyltransferase